MIPAPKSTAGGIIADCTLSGTVLTRMRFVPGSLDALELHSWDMILLASEPMTSYRDVQTCHSMIDFVAPAPTPPEPRSGFQCSMEPDHLDEPRMVWVLIRKDLEPSNLNPSIKCLTLLRYMGAPGGFATVPVTCTWK